MTASIPSTTAPSPNSMGTGARNSVARCQNCVAYRSCGSTNSTIQRSATSSMPEISHRPSAPDTTCRIATGLSGWSSEYPYAVTVIPASGASSMFCTAPRRIAPSATTSEVADDVSTA